VRPSPRRPLARASPRFTSSVSYPSAPQIPTIGFLYIAGYIGHVGRAYLLAIKGKGKTTIEKEYIIDVPLAIETSLKGFAWPAQVVMELRNGTLTEKDENITVSPR